MDATAAFFVGALFAFLFMLLIWFGNYIDYVPSSYVCSISMEEYKYFKYQGCLVVIRKQWLTNSFAMTKIYEFGVKENRTLSRAEFEDFVKSNFSQEKSMIIIKNWIHNEKPKRI